MCQSWLLFRYSQDQSSEEFIGEWAESRGIRDQLVIATKVSYRGLGLDNVIDAHFYASILQTM